MWFEGLRDERAVRDMIMAEIANEYKHKVDLEDYQIAL
jgi:hypothetical protein